VLKLSSKNGREGGQPVTNSLKKARGKEKKCTRTKTGKTSWWAGTDVKGDSPLDSKKRVCGQNSRNIGAEEKRSGKMEKRKTY